MDEHYTPFNFGPPMAHNVAQAVRTLVRVLSSVSAYRVAIASQYHRQNFCKSIALEAVASGVTSKAANGGHFKTGQRKWPGTRLFYSVAS
jgi:hypothetical protein